ncbi:MAG: alanyl-tRNA editing protein [Kouleothrix sp.]|jgi:alanyl-tRNA synthetase|nr:alanyl-tRNA editing protein [Kouleothrix sp.]
MHTERLYFADAYMAQFSAQVIARGQLGGRPAVALDQSAFYPEGGGQPADTGQLGGVAVLDVQADGELVWHALAAPLVAERLQGQLDWARRFDHMQQHHGQHLLSAAFERLYGFKTVSFHLGAAIATIDLAVAELAADQVAAAEDLTNQVIWEDRPILARFVTPEELARLPLRKPPQVAGPVRVVSVPEFDHSACGGTHPRSTGGVGLVHIRRWERRADAVRLEFVCGGRAVRDLRWKNAALGRLAGTLSVAAEELEPAVARLRTAEERARKRLEAASEQLIGLEAQELLARAVKLGGLPVVRRAYADRGLEELRMLAKALSARGGVALLGLRAEKTQLIFACAAGAPLDCGALLRATLAGFGGRGGGQPTLAQGGLPDGAQLEAALDAALKLLPA